LILAAAVALTACSKTAPAKPETTAAPAPAAAASSTYPLDTNVTVTWWAALDTNVAANYANQGDTPYGKALVKATGVGVEFQHPPAGAANEQFNLLLADGNLPDIMERAWLSYPGGPEKAIDDGHIVRLNDLLAAYCPNLTAYLKAHPDIDRAVKTDEGSYYVFPFVRGEDILLTTSGLMIRQDWLDDLGLPMPETIGDWHDTLTAFKTRKGAAAPLSFEFGNTSYQRYSSLQFPFKAERDFYIGDDGRVHFGANEDGFRDYLETMAAWYREGLLDPDILTVSFQQVSAKVTGGQTGATVGAVGSRMGAWLTSARATDPRFTLVGAPIPVLNKGDAAGFRLNLEIPFNGNGAAITTSCKNPEIAARLLDWMYSPAGSLLNNFGIEGESYTIVDGEPRYTDAVLNNPKGWPVGQSLAEYVRAVNGGPFVQDGRYLKQYYTWPEQWEALSVWNGGPGKKYKVPAITPTPDESREAAQIMNEINTYRDEMVMKFILGTESLSHWDTYTATIKKMGIDRALEIQNAALARYNAR